MKLLRAIGVTAAFATAIAGLGITEASADSRRSGVSIPTVGEFVQRNGIAAARTLNPELTTSEIVELSDDPTARMTATGKVLFVDRRFAPLTGTPASIPANVAGIPLTDFLSLNSNPGSSRTIFLDFDGHSVPAGTLWDDVSYGNGGDPIVSGEYPAFTMDGSASFSNLEKQAIINAWAAVAEDYAPFDVNVTTEFPGDEAINRTDSSDEVFGTRALISAGTAGWNADTCGCGGIAYMGVFNEAIDLYGFEHEEWQPAFIFFAPSDFVSTYMDSAAEAGKFISDVASHEVGHNLSLDHDGNTADGEYFQGQNDGINWAPIMGAGYYNGLAQWSNGDYAGASETEDDLIQIAATGAPFITDESNNATGSALFITGSATDGFIGRRNDVDWFKVTVTNRTLGVYSGPPTPNTNLDTKLTLRDGAGKELFSTDALSAMTEDVNGIGVQPLTGMDGVLNADLPNGTYFLTIEGVGRSGAYSDYGSLGAYSIKTRTPSVSSIAAIGNPTISGTRRKGRTLTANYGTWTSGVSIAKQWLRDGIAITGATSKSYVLKSADVGHKISVRLIGSKSGKRTAIKVSSKTATITN